MISWCPRCTLATPSCRCSPETKESKRPDPGPGATAEELTGPIAGVCCLCRFEHTADDCALRLGARTVCAGCYYRRAGDEHPMPKQLRRWVEEAMPA